MKYQAVCRSKKVSLGQFETQSEAVAVANKHKRNTGHRVRAFKVPEKVGKPTGKQLLNEDFDAVKELTIKDSKTKDSKSKDSKKEKKDGDA